MNTTDCTSNSIAIQLTTGQIAYVDQEDADLVKFKWLAIPQRGGSSHYATMRGSRKRNEAHTIYMHRLILARKIGQALLPHEFTDHIDGNTLNNCRANLRVATASQNQCNKGVQKNNTSGHKGVVWCKRSSRWRATVNVNGKGISLGYFRCLEDAINARREGVMKYHGEFARIGATE